MSHYRPWGHLNWLLGRLEGRSWSLIGCIGTETRSTAVASYLGRSRLNRVEMLAIHDPDPLDRSRFDSRIKDMTDGLVSMGFRSTEISRVDLLSDIETIISSLNRVDAGDESGLIIDITSLPKLWFFPIVQAALSRRSFSDIVITYTSALSYAEQLSENIAPLRVLPGFFADDGRAHHDSIIVGIGFEPLGLVPLLSEQTADRVRLIFPFPPGPPGHRRNWMFVKQIEELTQNQSIDPPDRVHIHMYDCPQVFDALAEMTNNGVLTSAIAPYGPKTVSLAMCLFSIAANAAGRPRVPVFYAQPHRYALDYSTGIRKYRDIPEISAYSVRLGGRDLYVLR